MSRQPDDAQACARRRAVLFALAGISVSALAPRRSGAALHALDWTPAREIVVEKGRRRLTLYRSDGTVRVFPCVLGASPRGHKEREGDNRTPEGRYVIDFKNINSRFFLSVRVSYPNAQDRARARAAGVRPGGNIMIHGMPNEARRPYRGLLTKDWTNGCVAVSNEAMMEIWLASRENTPVVLRA
ncbi:MAG: L,D-transpeptidase family protein [Pseudomonadota bacterium]